MSYKVWQPIIDTPHRLSLTGYWGGSEKGRCVQLTGTNCDAKGGYVGMTVAEARTVARELHRWAKRMEAKT